MINATLVTIHGFWSSPATWERLDTVWRADEELYGLRIHPFGYPSPKVPQIPLSTTRVPNYDDIAQTLVTEYTTVLARASDIALVTHSQGGLILQRFLAWMLNEGRGQDLARIRTIVMLACPNGGSEYLRSLRHVLGFGRHAQASSLEALNRQVADTQRTVLQRVVNATGVDAHQCPIPFHVYAGSSDKVVTAASAQSVFPGASVLPGNHFSILDPSASGNRTAAIVKHHILIDVATSHAHPVRESEDAAKMAETDRRAGHRAVPSQGASSLANARAGSPSSTDNHEVASLVDLLGAIPDMNNPSFRQLAYERVPPTVMQQIRLSDRTRLELISLVRTFAVYSHLGPWQALLDQLYELLPEHPAVSDLAARLKDLGLIDDKTPPVF